MRFLHRLAVRALHEPAQQSVRIALGMSRHDFHGHLLQRRIESKPSASGAVPFWRARRNKIQFHACDALACLDLAQREIAE